MKTQPPLRIDQPARYCLRLQGKISAEWGDWLEQLEVQVNGSGPEAVTTLTGNVRDQPALFGLLSFVRDLGVALLSVELVRTL